MPGIASGLASERSMAVELHAVLAMPPLSELSMTLVTPFGCRPLIDPPATRSMTPVAEGDKVRLPTVSMSPEKAVARSAGGNNASMTENGATLVSVIFSQGWNEESEGGVDERRSTD